MSNPVASAAAFHLSGGTTQVILGGVGALVRVPGDGYVIVRNLGANLAHINFLFSSDGVNFQEVPFPFFSSDGIPAVTNPQPWPMPKPSERGEYIRVTGDSTDTTVDIQIYSPDLVRLQGGRTMVK